MTEPETIKNPKSKIQNSLRILVMGAGSMGTAVGGFMAQGGHVVVLVGRDPHMEAIRRDGLHITGIFGNHHVRSLRTETDLAGLRRGDFDLIIIAVKSYDTAAAIDAVRGLVDADTLVCAYQNGLGNAECIAEVVGWDRVIGASVIYGVRLTEPGRAEVTVIAHPTTLGVYTPTAPADRVRAIVDAMNGAGGLPAAYTDQIATVVWAKVAYNSALNALSALLDVPYGVLAETEHTRETMRAIVSELYAVAHAMHVRMDPETAEAYYDVLIEKLIPPTAAHYASMREDLRQRRRTEIDALNGAICRFGHEHGVPCPTNTVLTRLIRAREHALGVKY